MAPKKSPGKKQFKRVRVCFGSQFEGIKSTMVRDAWPKKYEAADHIASIIRRQRDQTRNKAQGSPTETSLFQQCSTSQIFYTIHNSTSSLEPRLWTHESVGNSFYFKHKDISVNSSLKGNYFDLRFRDADLRSSVCRIAGCKENVAEEAAQLMMSWMVREWGARMERERDEGRPGVLYSQGTLPKT